MWALSSPQSCGRCRLAHNGTIIAVLKSYEIKRMENKEMWQPATVHVLSFFNYRKFSHCFCSLRNNMRGYVISTAVGQRAGSSGHSVELGFMCQSLRRLKRQRIYKITIDMPKALATTTTHKNKRSKWEFGRPGNGCFLVTVEQRRGAYRARIAHRRHKDTTIELLEISNSMQCQPTAQINDEETKDKRDRTLNSIDRYHIGTILYILYPPST